MTRREAIPGVFDGTRRNGPASGGVVTPKVSFVLGSVLHLTQHG